MSDNTHDEELRNERWQAQQYLSELETQLREANDRIMDIEPLEARLEVLEVTIEAMLHLVGDDPTCSIYGPDIWTFVHAHLGPLAKQKKAAPELTDATPNEGAGDESRDDEQLYGTIIANGAQGKRKV